MMAHLFGDSLPRSNQLLLKLKQQMFLTVSIPQRLKDPPAFSRTVQHRKAAVFLVFLIS